MPPHTAIVAPVIALVVWTHVIWAWMYATRIPAIRKTVNKIEVRFSVFVLSSLVLIALTVNAARIVF